jgi:hypothetical protein
MMQMSVQQLAAEVKRQQEFKRDFIARPMLGFAMSEEAGRLEVNGIGEFPIGKYAHADLAAFTEIDRPYYDRMLKEKPRLLATNVNAWLTDLSAKRRMIRTLEGQARAVRSNKFRALDNADLMQAALPALYDHPGIKIQSCSITESRLYLKAVLPKLEFEVKKGDLVQFGLALSNSEIGQGSLELSIFAFRLICLNGAVIEDGKFRRSHIGGRLGDDVAAEYFADETRKAADEAFFLKLRDTAKHLLTKAACKESVDKMRVATGQPIHQRPDKAVKEIGKKFGLAEAEQDSVLDFLLRGGDMTQWGMMNAITAAAKEIENYDRATDMEKMGGKLLELSQHEWDRVAA